MSIALKLHTVATFYEISLIVTIMSHGIIFIMSYRADTFLRRGTGDVSMIEESQNLSLFLANQNKITLLLKEGLEHIQGYEDVLADVLNMFVRLFESNMYITPNEKHVLLKVCLYFHIVAQDVVQVKDGAYYCYCAYVPRISRYWDFLSPMLTNTGIFLRGLKLSGESGS